jgi:hypothetical protein
VSLTTSYLLKTSNLEAFLNSLKTARAPEAFTHKFLKDLDFTTSNDRLFVGVLKGLGFIDENGVPTERYFAFLDQSQSGRVLAEGIRDAYDDLFAIRTDANNMDVDEVRGKLKTLTQGQKSENVVNQMAATFRALCDLADWNGTILKETIKPPTPDETPLVDLPELVPPINSGGGRQDLQLHYNIQIILPESRDPKVYDALFASLRRHLL